MSKSIVPVTQDAWQVIQSVAPVAAASRLFSVTEQQAAIVMLKGHELGLGMMASFEFIHVIDGKPSISPKGALAMIHQSGEEEYTNIVETVDKNGQPYSCEVTMKRRRCAEHMTKFTMDDAKRAGLVKPNGGWEKYPAKMLQWRAIGYCADVVYPDVIGGLLRPEELGATVDPEGDVIKSSDYLPPSFQKSAVVEESNPMVIEGKFSPIGETAKTDLSLNDLIVSGFTVDQIMAANENKIPATSFECNAVAEKLRAEGEKS